jgi:hypothetical protein
MIRWGRDILVCLAAASIIGVVALKVAPDKLAEKFPSNLSCDPKAQTFEECLVAAKEKGDAVAERAADRRAVTTATVALALGAISAFGAYLTARTFAANRKEARLTHELDQASQITERFTRAVDQLGNEAVDVRLGGIYALERLAQDSGTYRGPILEVLAAYVRTHAALKPTSASSVTWFASVIRQAATRLGLSTAEGADQGTPDEELSDAAIDVKAAMAVLARRDTSPEREPPAFDFGDTNLRGVRGEGIDLQLANLARAHLENARLDRAQLQSATLVGAHLQGAHFPQADLTGASLDSAHLEGAHLDAAEGLESASLRGAHFDFTTRFPRGFDAVGKGAVRLTQSFSGAPASVSPESLK